MILCAGQIGLEASEGQGNKLLAHHHLSGEQGQV